MDAHRQIGDRVHVCIRQNPLRGIETLLFRAAATALLCVHQAESPSGD